MLVSLPIELTWKKPLTDGGLLNKSLIHVCDVYRFPTSMEVDQGPFVQVIRLSKPHMIYQSMVGWTERNINCKHDRPMNTTQNPKSPSNDLGLMKWLDIESPTSSAPNLLVLSRE